MPARPTATTVRSGLRAASSLAPVRGFTGRNTFAVMLMAVSMFSAATEAECRTVAMAASRQSGSIRLTISEEMKCMMGAAT